ncbi:TrbI/VirB10 family protein [Granulicella tundricola]|uniref:Conjugation TrbI family protein n=1 Tax=Granulicella tundricola (strain ATCC BAA-1859 / DSM 23138 / MP5ACTX9) TaxID=1198114 RepID=E8X7F8_GRATM|nr:TrbI/VirB10 family protein [Granulicella tundricola]ADW71392.1 conjugation TrbI family protein [Granulicella tundricola MP5ACTX9]
MSETPATVPSQPESNAPIKKGFPILLILVAIVLLVGIANVSHLVSGAKKPVAKSALTSSPATVNPQQVSSYQTMQATEIKRDAEDRQVLAANQAAALQAQSDLPGPEADSSAPMTAAQRQSIYGDSPNAPRHTSNASQGHAEAQQRELAHRKAQQDAINSDTVAIDFAHAGGTPAAVLGDREQATNTASGEDIGSAAERPARPATLQTVADTRNSAKGDPMAPYGFDAYQGQLYRVFEGTVLEGVVTNHIDGGFSGPILVMLTTDYYSHDHQRLLMPQGTRLIGTVQSVGSQGQRKMFVTFYRAVCPDGFSLEFDKYIGLDPIGTTGLASKVDNHYLSAFGAAAAIGGLGGLAQIGNSASVLDPSAQIRNDMSQQTAQEGEQILNHFLNRLPTITLKEGSRARVYIGRDILIPSYADHRVDPTL